MGHVYQEVKFKTCDLCKGPINEDRPTTHMNSVLLPDNIFGEDEWDEDIWNIEICYECIEFLKKGLAKRVNINKALTEKKRAKMIAALGDSNGSS